jgi:integrase/recombinase XerD
MPQARTLTQSEVDQVLRYLSARRFAARSRAMVLTSLWSGMRVKEIAAVRVGDVRAEDGSLLREVRLTAEQTKGRRSRTVYMNMNLRDELASYLRAYPPTDAHQPLFWTERSQGWNANTLSQWFYWTYRNAGIVGASSHSGRRTFITTLANKGVGVRVLAVLAGHSSITTTQAYIDVNDEIKRSAVELI